MRPSGGTSGLSPQATLFLITDLINTNGDVEEGAAFLLQNLERPIRREMLCTIPPETRTTASAPVFGTVGLGAVIRSSSDRNYVSSLRSSVRMADHNGRNCRRSPPPGGRFRFRNNTRWSGKAQITRMPIRPGLRDLLWGIPRLQCVPPGNRNSAIRLPWIR